MCFQLEYAKPAERGDTHTLILHVEATVRSRMLGLDGLVDICQPCRSTFSMTDKLRAILKGTAAGVRYISIYLHARSHW